MADKLKSGDKVKWSSTQGEITGHVTKKVTRETKIKRHVAKATAANPQFVVKSDKTGAEAIHKPDALTKV